MGSEEEKQAGQVAEEESDREQPYQKWRVNSTVASSHSGQPSTNFPSSTRIIQVDEEQVYDLPQRMLATCTLKISAGTRCHPLLWSSFARFSPIHI